MSLPTWGPSFFELPGALALPFFDAVGYVDRVARKLEEARVDGVLSSDEYVGAAIAAAVGKKLGLPLADPGKILIAQHKYASRGLQKRVVPEAVPDFALIPIEGAARGGHAVPLHFPFFVKPLKGTFSVFAGKIVDPEALERHRLSFLGALDASQSREAVCRSLAGLHGRQDEHGRFYRRGARAWRASDARRFRIRR
jgi:hypothetical protein